MPAPSVYLETFGCQMNVLDSQLVTSQLRALGYRFVDDWRAADVVLYNTCSVREQAENKVYSRIGLVGKHKRDRPEVVLGVIGCMAERDGEDILRRHPEIDVLVGPGELDKVPALIDNAIRTDLGRRARRDAKQVALRGDRTRRSGTLAAAEDTLELIDLARSFAPSAVSTRHDGSSGDADADAADDQANRSAYVRITRGCNKFCTYCVVPKTRGAEVHRPADHIVAECRKLAEAGVIEVTLLGQTVNHYHYDTAAAVTVKGVQQPQVGTVISPNRGTGGPSPTFSPTTVSFADLLARIHDEVPGLRRLRFVTSYPRDFGDDILDVIAERPRICRYFHLPVQSGSDAVLARMNRGYTAAEYLDLVDRIRDKLPMAELATDIITGFPGETEADHEATCALLCRARFKNAFIFKYSPRPGTVAIDRFDDDVPTEVKRRRNQELLAIQAEASAAVHAGYVGRTVRVFVESVSAKTRKAHNGAAPGSPEVTLGWQPDQDHVQLTGRTDGDLIVCFEGDPSLIGRLVDVRVERSAPLTLFGALAREPAAV